jgi:hypothetical protein
MTSSRPGWLPELLYLRDYDRDWERYLQAVYSAFCTDFINGAPDFRGLRIALKRHPLTDGKEATFWHLISEGKTEEERLPDLRRCERIRWPRPIISHDTDPLIKVWENERNGEPRICLWLENQEYLVVLARRKGYILLWTAYLVTQDHQKRKLQKEYEAYKKADAAF